MTTTPPRHICRIVTTDIDESGLATLAVDCPNRPEMPPVETCLKCAAFVTLGAHGHAATDVVCTPSTVRARVRQELGLPPDETPPDPEKRSSNG